MEDLLDWGSTEELLDWGDDVEEVLSKAPQTIVSPGILAGFRKELAHTTASKEIVEQAERWLGLYDKFGEQSYTPMLRGAMAAVRVGYRHRPVTTAGNPPTQGTVCDADITGQWVELLFKLPAGWQALSNQAILKGFASAWFNTTTGETMRDSKFALHGVNPHREPITGGLLD